MKRDSSESSKMKEYEALFNSVNDAVALHYFDSKGNPSNFINVNNVMCERYGYSKAELLKMSPAQIDEPEAFKKYGFPGIKKLMKEGKVTFETVHLTKKGQKIPVEINATIFYMNGKKTMLAVARDITERKKAEYSIILANAKNREYNKLLKNIADNLPGYMAYVDLDTLKYVYANDAYRKSFGLPLDKIIGHHIKEVLGKAAYKVAKKYIAEVRKGKSTSYEHDFDLKRGKRWIKVNYVPGFDSEGEVVSVIVMSYDITEQKNATNAIKKSEEKFRTFFKSIPVPTYTWQQKDDDIVLVDYNNAVSGSTQGAIKKLIGIKLNSMYKDTSVQNRQIKSDMKRCLREKKIIEKDMKYQLQTSHENKFLHVKYAYVPPNCVMVHTEDITKQRKAEEKIRENEKRLTNVIDSTPFPIAIVDVSDEKMLYWSKSSIALFGHNPKTTGEWYNLAYPNQKYRQEVIKRWKSYLKIASKSKKPINTDEYNITCKDGSVKVCELHFMFTKENLIVTLNDITEKKKAKEDIIKSQKLLQRIIDLLPIRVFWKDKDLKFLGGNEIFAKDAGKHSPEELIGKNDFQMNWKEQAKLYRTDDQNVMKSGKSRLNFEELQTTPKGDKIWLKTSKIPLTDSEGNAIGILGTYEDITERKKAEATLRESEEKYNAILEYSTDQIFMLDSNLKYLSVGKSLAKSLGQKPEDMIDKSIIDIFGKSNQEIRFMENIKSVLNDGKSKSIEEEIILKGKKNYISTQLSPVKDSSGKITAVLGIVRNNTKSKNAEEKTKQEQTLTKAIVESTDDMIWSVDPKNFTLLTFNHGLSNHFLKKGISMKVGMHPKDLYPNEKFHKTWCDFYRRALVEGSYTTEYTGMVGEVVLQLTFNIVKHEGNVFGISVFGTNITERKKAEEELRESKETMRLKIEELETFHKITVGRELRMVELKEKIKELEEKLGKNHPC